MRPDSTPSAIPPKFAPTWPRVVALVALLGLIFFVSRSCQQSQVRISQSEALATAKAQVDFKPTDTAIRLLRQGLSTKPFWIVVLYTRTTTATSYPGPRSTSTPRPGR